jgi:large subunit ribosomal protein L29
LEKKHKQLEAKDLREMTVDELRRKSDDLSRELMRARFAKANQQLKNPLKIREIRRSIARILTIMHEKKGQMTQQREVK